jgi:hypothetical protein
VGVMDKGQLPLTTDVVFHNVGYDITFTLESQDFIPAITPNTTPNSGRDNGGNEDADRRKENTDHTTKKQRNINNSFVTKTNTNGNQTTPMQVDSLVALNLEANSLLASLASAPCDNGFGTASKLVAPLIKQGTRAYTQQTTLEEMQKFQRVVGQTLTSQDKMSPQGDHNTALVDVVGKQTVKEQPLHPTLNMQKITDGLSKNTSPVHTKSSPPRHPLTRTGSNGRALNSISSQDAAAKGITNPLASMKGTLPENFHSINGLRRSLRNNTKTIDGLYSTDEPVLDKAMRRIAEHNLDIGGKCRERTLSNEGFGMSEAGDTGMSTQPSSYSFESLSDELCERDLSNLGFKMEKDTWGINFSLNALRRIERDRCKENQIIRPDPSISPFELSDDEATDGDGALLAHLIKDVSEVDLETEDLDTKLCDLMASSRKSHKNRKNKKNT